MPLLKVGAARVTQQSSLAFHRAGTAATWRPVRVRCMLALLSRLWLPLQQLIFISRFTLSCEEQLHLMESVGHVNGFLNLTWLW